MNAPYSTAPHSIAYGILRIVSAIFAIPVTAFVFLMLVNALNSKVTLLGSGILLSVGTVASICWWFALLGHIAKSRVQIKFTVLGAVIIGCISFAVGFVGPILLAPRSNQGPLLGIFVTGPFGVVAGAMIGAFIGCVRTHRMKGSEMS
jgi:hypothetical protein